MIENIRRPPGFERFLLASTEDELKAAAAHDRQNGRFRSPEARRGHRPGEPVVLLPLAASIGIGGSALPSLAHIEDDPDLASFLFRPKQPYLLPVPSSTLNAFWWL